MDLLTMIDNKEYEISDLRKLCDEIKKIKSLKHSIYKNINSVADKIHSLDFYWSTTSSVLLKDRFESDVDVSVFSMERLERDNIKLDAVLGLSLDDQSKEESKEVLPFDIFD